MSESNQNCSAKPVFVPPTPPDGSCIPVMGTYSASLVAYAEMSKYVVNHCGEERDCNVCKNFLCYDFGDRLFAVVACQLLLFLYAFYFF